MQRSGIDELGAVDRAKKITGDEIVLCPRHGQPMWICCTRPWNTSWWCPECDKEYERNIKGDLVIKPPIRIKRVYGRD